MTGDLLTDAIDLIPEPWHEDILADAQTQGCAVAYVPAPTGPNAETVHRVQAYFADRHDDPAWWALPDGQRLDDCFPDHHGVGSWELLDALGITAEYVEMSDREGMIQQ